MILPKKHISSRPKIKVQLPFQLTQINRSNSQRPPFSNQNSNKKQVQPQVYSHFLLKRPQIVSCSPQKSRDLGESREKKVLTYLLKVVKEQCKDSYKRKSVSRDGRYKQRKEKANPLHVLQSSLSIGAINISKKQLQSSTHPSPPLWKELNKKGFEKNKQIFSLQRRHSYLHAPARELREKELRNQEDDLLEESQENYLQTRQQPSKPHFSRRNRVKTMEEENRSGRPPVLVRENTEKNNIKAQSDRVMEVSKLDMVSIAKLEVKVREVPKGEVFLKGNINRSRRGSKKKHLISANLSEGEICLNQEVKK